MAERKVCVVVDEALSKSRTSYLKVGLNVDGKEEAEIIFQRNASPQYISQVLNETGCLIKYEEVITWPEEEKQKLGDAYIQASYIVPGLKE
jgi:hypothetical protein